MLLSNSKIIGVYRCHHHQNLHWIPWKFPISPCYIRWFHWRLMTFASMSKRTFPRTVSRQMLGGMWAGKAFFLDFLVLSQELFQMFIIVEKTVPICLVFFIFWLLLKTSTKPCDICEVWWRVLNDDSSFSDAAPSFRWCLQQLGWPLTTSSWLGLPWVELMWFTWCGASKSSTYTDASWISKIHRIVESVALLIMRYLYFPVVPAFRWFDFGLLGGSPSCRLSTMHRRGSMFVKIIYTHTIHVWFIYLHLGDFLW